MRGIGLWKVPFAAALHRGPAAEGRRGAAACRGGQAGVALLFRGGVIHTKQWFTDMQTSELPQALTVVA